MGNEAKKLLAQFKREFDPQVEKYLNQVLEEVRRRDFFTAEILEYVKKIVLAGGKRIRPAFMYWGYLGMGGKEKEKILKTAIGIELVHIFLLIHDDIIDRDDKRHGMDTLHFKYKKWGKKIFPRSDSSHFGNSIALVAGDIVAALGNQVIFNSAFESRLIMKALFKLQEIISLTALGEIQDIYVEYQGKASEEEILQMYKHKTAGYTVEGPLHLGAILAGASDDYLKELSALAIPLGIAFQIRDDILGIFGNEEKLGKPVGSDIKEGKQTLLVSRAWKKANSDQRKILTNILGKKDLSHEDIENFRSVIISSGALRYAEDMVKKNIQESQRIIRKINFTPEARHFLLEISEYIARREI